MDKISTPESIVVPESSLPPLYQPVDFLWDETTPDGLEEDEQIDPTRWRATILDPELPGKVLGKLVHKALQRWCFPDDPHLKMLLEAKALHAGLVNSEQRSLAIQQTIELLERLHQHPLYQQISAASERHHELSYSIKVFGRFDNRYIDLLYRDAKGWQIIDFKSDPIRTAAYREELIMKYSSQVHSYQRAIKQLLGVNASASICFLDDHERVTLVEVA